MKVHDIFDTKTKQKVAFREYDRELYPLLMQFKQMLKRTFGIPTMGDIHDLANPLKNIDNPGYQFRMVKRLYPVYDIAHNIHERHQYLYNKYGNDYIRPLMRDGMFDDTESISKLSVIIKNLTTRSHLT